MDNLFPRSSFLEEIPYVKTMNMQKITCSLLTLLAASLLVLAGATPALAQQQSEAPAYQQEYKAGIEAAKQAQQLEETNPAQAAEAYAEAYVILAEAAEMAEAEGATGNANKIRTLAAKLAYQAGMLLHNSGQSEAAIEHFEYGIELAPAFAKNREGLSAAQASLKQGPVVAASQAINSDNPQKALDLLQDAEPSPDVYFYRAVAYQALNNPQQAAAAANQALEAGGNSATREGRLYLILGEAQIALGNSASARAALQQAQAQGAPQTSARAQALLDQLGE